MSRISLKDLATFRSTFVLKDSDAELLKAKFIDTTRTTAGKTANAYGADESYTKLFAMGPIVDELTRGVKALENEMTHLHEYITGQLGRDADKTLLPPNVAFTDALGNEYNLITFDEATKTSQINVDELFVGPNSLYVNGKKVIEDNSDTINISTDPGQNLVIKTLNNGILQFSAQEGGMNFNSTGGVTFNSDITINSAKSISGSNATTGLQLGKTQVNGQLTVDGNIILPGTAKIAFAGDAANFLRCPWELQGLADLTTRPSLPLRH